MSHNYCIRTMDLSDVPIPVNGGSVSVLAKDAVGYGVTDRDGKRHVIIGYGFECMNFLLDSGKRVPYGEVSWTGVDDLVPCGWVWPPIGKAVDCILGNGIVEKCGARSAHVAFNHGTYVLACHLLRPLHVRHELQHVRVCYGAAGASAISYAKMVVHGGASVLRTMIERDLRAAGVVINGPTQLVQMHSLAGGATAVRELTCHPQLLLRLNGDITGTANGNDDAFTCLSADSAVAHTAAGEYLMGSPWVLPMTLKALQVRCFVEVALQPELLAGGPYVMKQDMLYLGRVPRTCTKSPCHVDTESLLLGVRAGHVEAQSDGTFAMEYRDGEWGAVGTTGMSLRDLAQEVDRWHDMCMPIGEHAVHIEGCPTVLIHERFGEFYDPATGIVSSLA
jgi:hypothetical protein